MNRTALACSLDSVRLQAHEILRNIKLEFPAGQWTAIVGPNGAGKSTLLRALAGLTAAKGSIALLGRPLQDWPTQERARQLAWLGQNESSTDELTAADVVALGRLPHQGWLAPASPSDRAAVQEAMQQTQCWAWRERRLNTLSGGERQRVLLARALAVQAPVLLMDEPLAHLDPPHQADWLGIVRQLTGAGLTVISVLHELNMALQADGLVVMGGGQVLHHGPAQEPATRAALQTVFDHRLKLLQLEGQWLALPHTRP